MLFTTYKFIFIFLPLTLIGYFLIASQKKDRWALAWLVFASLIFYAAWKPAYIFLLIFSKLSNYFVGYAVSPQRQHSFNRKWLLIGGLILNLGLLGYYKYANFFVDTVNGVLGTSFYLEKILLPLGISFFVFQEIAYIVDAYEGKAKDYDLLNYSLFVSFFPQLIAGPIVHHNDIIPQI